MQITNQIQAEFKLNMVTYLPNNIKRNLIYCLINSNRDKSLNLKRYTSTSDGLLVLFETLVVVFAYELIHNITPVRGEKACAQAESWDKRLGNEKGSPSGINVGTTKGEHSVSSI